MDGIEQFTSPIDELDKEVVDISSSTKGQPSQEERISGLCLVSSNHLVITTSTSKSVHIWDATTGITLILSIINRNSVDGN